MWSKNASRQKRREAFLHLSADLSKEIHLLALNAPAADPVKAYLLFAQYQLIGTTACTNMEHTLQQARHALGYYRSQKYWQDDLRAYQDSKYDAVRAFSFEKSEGCHSFSKVEGEYPYPYEQRQREWKRFWPEGLEEAKPPAYAGAGTYRYPYLNLENGETETVSVRFDRDCTAPVPPRVSEKGRRKAISVTLDELLNTAKEMAEMHPGDPCYAILMYCFLAVLYRMCYHYKQSCHAVEYALAVRSRYNYGIEYDIPKSICKLIILWMILRIHFPSIAPTPQHW